MTRRMFAWGIVAGLTATLLVVVVVGVLVSASKSSEIRETQVLNTRTLDTTERTLEVLLDCTNPEGRCYRRGVESRRGIVEDVSRVAVYAAACADRPRQQSVAQIQACILDEIDDAEDDKP